MGVVVQHEGELHIIKFKYIKYEMNRRHYEGYFKVLCSFKTKQIHFLLILCKLVNKMMNEPLPILSRRTL